MQTTSVRSISTITHEFKKPLGSFARHKVLWFGIATYLFVYTPFITISFILQSRVWDTVVINFGYVGLPLTHTFLIQL